MIYAYLMKFIIVGDSGVGKTSIMQRFVSDNYDQYISSTIGVDFGARIIDIAYKNRTIPIKSQIWDTAGLETFRSITKTYYKNAAGVVYVYDITNADTFRNLSEWISEVKLETSNDIPGILIGSKLDNKLKRVVKYEEAEDFAKKNKMEYIEVSSKDNSNIDMIFDTLIKSILNNIYKNNKTPNGVRQIEDRLFGELDLHSSDGNPPKCCSIQ